MVTKGQNLAAYVLHILHVLQRSLIVAALCPGNLAMVTGGHNLGRVGTITHREKHPGSFDIVHIKDTLGHSFATRSVLLLHLYILSPFMPAVAPLPLLLNPPPDTGLSPPHPILSPPPPTTTTKQ